ncbi:hypothetical protein SteCoe_23782 [Stentor coeruleus]|uniref:Uncharacterized protein n=1 Tax=Stentor coeruleus TaxID=5963 RepID=A0A1R2BJ46_9CILI|nr:hypothetical protein SteCoe_23782 [Stentor coeruleus]
MSFSTHTKIQYLIFIFTLLFIVSTIYLFSPFQTSSYIYNILISQEHIFNTNTSNQILSTNKTLSYLNNDEILQNSSRQKSEEDSNKVDVKPKIIDDFKSKFVEVKEKRLRADEEITDLSTTCKPYNFDSFGLKRIFDKKIEIFYECKRNNMPYVVLNTTYVQVECPNGDPGWYLLGPSLEFETYKISYPKINWKPFMGKIEVEVNYYEFVMVYCTEFNKQSKVQNKFLPLAYDRASKLANQFSSSYKPFGMHVIILSSLSRQQFYTTLTETAEFINTEIEENDIYNAYDFLINNGQSKKSRESFISMLLGKNIEEHLKYVKGANCTKDIFDDFFKEIQEDSVWKYYEKMGYVTMIGFDNMENDTCHDFGKKINTDHSLAGFWNTARGVFKYDSKDFTNKCFGDKNAHKIVLEYLEQFIRNYQGVNKFSINKITVGLDSENNSVTVLDKNLKNTIYNIIQIYKNSNEDFMIMLTSDHGWETKTFNNFIDNFIESSSSLNILFTKKSLINSLGSQTNNILSYNTQKLISPTDWYLSLHHLAHAPYGELQSSSTIYKSIKNKVKNSNFLSVFMEKITDTRTCLDIDIFDHFCQCTEFETIPLNSLILKKGIFPVVILTAEHLNSYYIDGIFCKDIDIDEILEVYQLRLNLDSEDGNGLIKVISSVVGFINVRIEFLIYVGVEAEIEKMESLSNYPVKRHFFDRKNGLVEVGFVVVKARRIDEHKCKDKKMAHDVCLC